MRAQNRQVASPHINSETITQASGSHTPGPLLLDLTATASLFSKIPSAWLVPHLLS